MGMLRDDPGGHFAAGYHDGAAGKKFSPPSDQARKPAAELNPFDDKVAIKTICPNCGALDWFEWKFLGRLTDPGCGHSWYVGSGTYVAMQFRAAFAAGHKGAKYFNSGVSGGEGAWIAKALGWFLGVVLGLGIRLELGVLMVPIQALAGLFQAKKDKSDTLIRVIVLVVFATAAWIGAREIRAGSERSSFTAVAGGPLATGAQTIVPGGGAQLKLQAQTAIYNGDVQQLRALLAQMRSAGIDINGPADMNGPAYKTQYTLLYAASSGPMNGSTMVKLLLDNGADPRRDDSLLRASLNLQVDIVALLLAKGADPYRMHGTQTVLQEVQDQSRVLSESDQQKQAGQIVEMLRKAVGLTQELPAGQDTIEIVSVTPPTATPLRADQPTEFIVLMRYSLRSVDQAVVDLYVEHYYQTGPLACEGVQHGTEGGVNFEVFKGDHEVSSRIAWSPVDHRAGFVGLGMNLWHDGSGKPVQPIIRQFPVSKCYSFVP
jgi:hypothetical protein